MSGKHGGARPGSGRKPLSAKLKKQIFGVSLAPELVRWIKATAAERGESVSAFVEGILSRSMRAQRGKR